VCVLQARFTFLNRGAEDLDLLQHLCALIRDPVDRVDPGHEVVDRARTEQDLEIRVLAAGGVHDKQALGEHRLRVTEVRPG
jgi:hypothetical protein